LNAHTTVSVKGLVFSSENSSQNPDCKIFLSIFLILNQVTGKKKLDFKNFHKASFCVIYRSVLVESGRDFKEAHSQGPCGTKVSQFLLLVGRMQ